MLQQLQFKPCGCDPHYHQRMHRNWRMRVFWTRRLYLCKDCLQYLLIPKQRRAHAPLTLTPGGA